MHKNTHKGRDIWEIKIILGHQRYILIPKINIQTSLSCKPCCTCAHKHHIRTVLLSRQLLLDKKSKENMEKRKDVAKEE